MEILRFSIAAGETKTIERAGNYIELLTVPTTINVRMIGRSGERGESLLGVEAGTYAEGKFSGLEVENPSGSAQSVAIMITNGRGGSRKIPGIIDANINSAAVANLGKHFAGWVEIPDQEKCLIDSSNGNPLAVHQLVFSNVFAEARIEFGSSVSAYVASSTIPAASGAFQNKIIGGAAPGYARIRHGTAATTIAGRRIIHRLFENNGTTYWQFIWRPVVPLIITGTNVLSIYANGGTVGFMAEVEELA